MEDAISTRSGRSERWPWLVLGAAALAWLAARGAAVYSVAFNWDEFVVLQRAALSVTGGVLRGGGHGGLSELILAPLVSACSDEILVGQRARLVWLAIAVAQLAGLAALVSELLRGRPGRVHDTALAVSAFALLPVVLEWSLQVRTDHIAVAGGLWGGALLLRSRRHVALAAPAGLAFALGWLSSQKLAYLALLALCLEVGTLVLRREWRPRREALRAVALVAVAFAATSAYRAGVALLFTVPDAHPTAPVPEAAWVKGYLDIFDFYRKTLGYDQHVAVLPSLVPHALVFAGLALASLRMLRERALDARIPLAWGSGALGVAVALFHAAAFGYFWITLAVFLATALGLALGPAREQLPERWRPAAALVLWTAIAVPGVFASAALLDDSQRVQRESLDFVERNFHPEDPGFHPEAAVFCRSQPLGIWLSQSIYQRVGAPGTEANIPRVIDRFRRERIHYLVESFRLNQFPGPIRRFLADHYQPYRASVFVAGRRLEGAAGERLEFDLVVPGVYRWLPASAPQPIRIDGQQIAPGGTLHLDATRHRADFDADVAGGALVLAVAEPPGPAPLAFYKTY